MSLKPTATPLTSELMPLTSAGRLVLTVFVLVCGFQHTDGQGSIPGECLQKCQVQLQRYTKFIPPSPYLDSLFLMCARTMCPDTTQPSTVTTTTRTPSTTTTVATTSTTPAPTFRMSLSSLLFSSVSSTPTSSPTMSSSIPPPTSRSNQESNSTSSIVSSTYECGLQRVSLHNHRMRIVGGFPAAECEYPWLVHITIRNPWYPKPGVCGGAILDGRRILTAAHCVVDSIINAPVSVGIVIVRVGSSSTSQAQVHTVVNISLHPQYDRLAKVNDVAVLTIAGEFTFSTCVAPICLPKEGGDPSSRDVCVVAGWGTTDYLLQASTLELREVEVPIVEQSLCQRSYDQSRVSDRTLCAGDFYYGGKDSCTGDSGAPLMCREQGVYVVRGIVSYGDECAKPNFPGIYTRVSHPQVLSFILQHLEGGR